MSDLTGKTIYVLQNICRTDGTDTHRAFSTKDAAMHALVEDCWNYMPNYGDPHSEETSALIKVLKNPNATADEVEEAWTTFTGCKEWLGILELVVDAPDADATDEDAAE